MAIIDPQMSECWGTALIVRVAGYSDYFCDLSEALQDEIIQRTEHTQF